MRLHAEITWQREAANMIALLRQNLPRGSIINTQRALSRWLPRPTLVKFRDRIELQIKVGSPARESVFMFLASSPKSSTVAGWPDKVKGIGIGDLKRDWLSLIQTVKELDIKHRIRNLEIRLNEDRDFVRKRSLRSFLTKKENLAFLLTASVAVPFISALLMAVLTPGLVVTAMVGLILWVITCLYDFYYQEGGGYELEIGP